MRVRVVLLSVLSKKLPLSARGRTSLDLPDDSTIFDVKDALEITLAVVCSLNGMIKRDFSYLLKDGDELKFIRPISGG